MDDRFLDALRLDWENRNYQISNVLPFKLNVYISLVQLTLRGCNDVVVKLALELIFELYFERLLCGFLITIDDSCLNLF